MGDIIKTIETEEFLIEYKETSIKRMKTNQHINHYHNKFEIAIFDKANLTFFYHYKKYNIKDGDILFINEYEIHKFIYEKTNKYSRYVINFKKNFLEGLLDDLKIKQLLSIFTDGNSLFNITDIDINKIKYLIDPLLHMRHQSNLSNTDLAQIKSTLVLIMITLSKLHHRSAKYKYEYNKKDELTKGIIEYINNNYHDNITLDSISQNFNLDKYYICHFFKESTGFTITNYIQQKRIIQAQKMLKNPHEAIINVCYACGFSNLQHFYKVFKKITNTTPSKFKKSH